MRQKDDVAKKDKEIKTNRLWYHKLFGLFCSVVSAISFAGAGILFRMTESATPSLTSLVIFVPQYLVLLPVITAKKVSITGPDRMTFGLLLLRGFIGSLVVVITNFALTKIPLGDAATLFAVNVPAASILARIFLKEPCGILEAVMIVFTVVGVVFIAEPPFIFGTSTSEELDASERIIGIFFGLAAAILSAFVIILIRKLGKTVHFTLSTFYFTWTGPLTCTLLILLTESFTIPCLVTLGYMFVISGFHFLSVLIFTLGLEYEEAGPITLIFTTQVAFGYFFEYIFLQTLPTMYGVIGSVLILFSSCCLIIKKIRQS